MERSRRGITQIVHPCLAGCLQPVTGTTSKITFQNGGKLVSDLLGLDRESFIALTVNTSYYVGEEHVASSVAAIPVTEVEKMGISVDDQPRLNILCWRSFIKGQALGACHECHGMGRGRGR